MSYKIYYVDLGRATGIPEIGTRPVVSYRLDGEFAIVYKITSRMRPDFRHVRMNPYKINGFCDISKSYRIHKGFLKSYQRDCTLSEIQLIKNATSKINKNVVI